MEANDRERTIRNTGTERASWQWDGRWYHLEPGESRAFPEWLCAHAMRTCHPHIETLEGNEGTLAAAKSKVDNAKRRYAEAQTLLQRADAAVRDAEKDLKIAQATFDAETKRQVPAGEPSVKPEPKAK